MVPELHLLQAIDCLVQCQKLVDFLLLVYMGYVSVGCNHLSFLEQVFTYYLLVYVFSLFNLLQHQFQLLLLVGCQIHLQYLIQLFLVDL